MRSFRRKVSGAKYQQSWNAPLKTLNFSENHLQPVWLPWISAWQYVSVKVLLLTSETLCTLANYKAKQTGSGVDFLRLTAVKSLCIHTCLSPVLVCSHQSPQSLYVYTTGWGSLAGVRCWVTLCSPGNSSPSYKFSVQREQMRVRNSQRKLPRTVTVQLIGLFIKILRSDELYDFHLRTQPNSLSVLFYGTVFQLQYSTKSHLKCSFTFYFGCNELKTLFFLKTLTEIVVCMQTTISVNVLRKNNVFNSLQPK